MDVVSKRPIPIRRQTPASSSGRRRIRAFPKTFPVPLGQRGFNDQVRKTARTSNLNLVGIGCDFATRPRLQPYQEMLKWLVTPQSKIQRVLVQWQLGAGKTLGMISILDNFFADPRPKIVVFPNAQLVQNFYQELSTKPNKYKQWFERAHGKYPRDGTAKAKRDWQTNFELECHRIKGGGGLAGPLRAFTYSRAGGAVLAKNAITRVAGRGESSGAKNLSKFIVLCDEAHNMVCPGNEFNKRQQKLMKLTGTKIQDAHDSVVCLFTATPIKNSLNDFVSLMRIVTGNPQIPLQVRKSVIVSDLNGVALQPVPQLAYQPGMHGALEGYISCFMDRPPELFATTKPNSASIFPEIVECALSGRMLRKYIATRFFKSGKLPKVRIKKADVRKIGKLWNNSNKRWVVDNDKNRAKPDTQETKPSAVNTKTAELQCVVADALEGNKECTRTIQTYENVMMAKYSTLKAYPGNPLDDTTSKIAGIVSDLQNTKLKTAILMHKSSGYDLLVDLLRKEKGAEQVLAVRKTPSAPTAAQRRAAQEEIDKFNNVRDNMDGRAHQIIVLAAEQFSEGISLFGVRQIILPDLSSFKHQATWADLKQRVGRALRLCSHHKQMPRTTEDKKAKNPPQMALPPTDRTLHIKLYVATMPTESKLQSDVKELTQAQVARISKAQTFDQIKLAKVLAQYHEFEGAQSFIASNSFEYTLL